MMRVTHPFFSCNCGIEKGSLLKASTHSWEASSEMPRSLHDVLSKHWPRLKLYVATDSEIGATGTLHGSNILHSLKGKYRPYIKTRDHAFDQVLEDYRLTYFLACPNLRELECENSQQEESVYLIDQESFSRWSIDKSAHWPPLEKLKICSHSVWLGSGQH